MARKEPELLWGVGSKAEIILEQAERGRWTLGAGAGGVPGTLPLSTRGEATQPGRAMGRQAFQSTQAS